jgi:uncharacterized membrane protein YdjX (TVP38/TMEM64 family)
MESLPTMADIAKWQRRLGPLVWALVLVAFLVWMIIQEGTFEDTAWKLVWGLQNLFNGPLGFFLVIPLYFLSSTLFFPNTPLLIIGGFVFGPVAGVLCGWLGMVTAAVTAYGLGRWLGPDWRSDSRLNRLLGKYAERLRKHSFETVLFLRLCWIALDLDAYLAGALRIPFRPFLLGAVLGCLPGCITLGLAGASLNLDREGEVISVGFDWRMIIMAVVVFALGLAASRILRRRQESVQASTS